MKATVRWLGEVAFVGESGSGHGIVLDGAPEHGGRNVGLRPMEAVLVGVGACSAFDVVTILAKSRERVTDCRVELEAQRYEEIPKVFTCIDMLFVVEGRELSPSKVRRAIDLSAEKYCSASAMMRTAGVELTHTFEIVEAR
jgi:putative redox protein